MKINKKFIFTFILFLLILLIFSLSSNAVDKYYSITHNEKTIQFNDFSDLIERKYQCIFINASGTYLYLFDSNVPIHYTGESLHSDSNNKTRVYRIDLNSGSREWSDWGTVGGLNFGANIPEIFYSNHDIINDTNQTVFFPITPLPSATEPLQGIIVVEELPQILVGILMKIIPVGLVILGIGLVIYLTRRVKYFSR